MNTVKINYSIIIPDNSPLEFPFEFDEDDFSLIKESGLNYDWEKLDYQKCSHCTLNHHKYPECPLVDTLIGIGKKADKFISYNKIVVKVTTHNRAYEAETTAQAGLASLFGLVIPTCGCPHTSFFRPMARFHLPFSNKEETVYRVFSLFLIEKFLASEDMQKIVINIDELNKIYKNMNIINRFISDILRNICKNDASINAIICLDMFSHSIRTTIKNDLNILKNIFRKSAG